MRCLQLGACGRVTLGNWAWRTGPSKGSIGHPWALRTTEEIIAGRIGGLNGSEGDRASIVDIGGAGAWHTGFGLREAGCWRRWTAQRGRRQREGTLYVMDTEPDEASSVNSGRQQQPIHKAKDHCVFVGCINAMRDFAIVVRHAEKDTAHKT